MSVTICNCLVPVDVLEHIGYTLVALTPLGNPSALIPLLLTSRGIYNALSLKSGTSLYARICRLKFDVGAVTRRAFDPHTRDLNDHLVQMCQLLQCIRRGDIWHEDAVDYLPSAFTAMLDNDGKNRAQLEHAGIEEFLSNFIHSRLYEGRSHNDMWPIESPQNTCALWLTWMFTNPEKLEAETLAQREAILGLVLPYVICPYKYASAYAPSNHFQLPLGETNPVQQQIITFPTVHGPFPVYHTERQGTVVLPHFRSSTPVLLPPITAAAKLLYWCRHEVTPFFHLPPHLPLPLPPTEGHHPETTQQNLIDLNLHKAAKLPETLKWDWEEGRPSGRPDRAVPSSEMWDMDWWRMRMCRSVLERQPRWRLGHVYLRGMLSGVWQGVYFLVNEGNISHLLRNAECPADLSSWPASYMPQPLIMDFQEHGYIRMPAANEDYSDGLVRQKCRSACCSLPIPSADPQLIRGFVNRDNKTKRVLIPIDRSGPNAWLPGPVGGLRWAQGPELDAGILCSSLPPQTAKGATSTATCMESTRFFVPVSQASDSVLEHPPSSSYSSHVYETYDAAKHSVHDRMVNAREEGEYFHHTPGSSAAKSKQLSTDTARIPVTHPGCLRCADREAYLAKRRELDHRSRRRRRHVEASFSAIGMGRAERSGSPSSSSDSEEELEDDLSEIVDFDVGFHDEDEGFWEDDMDSYSQVDEGPGKVEQEEEMDHLDCERGYPDCHDVLGDMDGGPLRRSHDRYKLAHCDDGVEDTIITSQLPDFSSPPILPLQRHSIYYGRVRPWDGLIAILKQEMIGDRIASFLFYGYIYGGENFVGNWRYGVHDPLTPDFESCFVMSKRKGRTSATSVAPSVGTGS